MSASSKSDNASVEAEGDREVCKLKACGNRSWEPLPFSMHVVQGHTHGSGGGLQLVIQGCQWQAAAPHGQFQIGGVVGGDPATGPDS